MNDHDVVAHPPDLALLAIATDALDLVPEGSTIGLGTGRAASVFIAALGARVREGFKITGVPTSEASERQARALGIEIDVLREGRPLEMIIDGADEVAPNLDLIKGRGGAVVRERIVAAASRRQVILVGSDKLVTALGEREPVPVEIIPMSMGLVLGRLKPMGLTPTLRRASPDGPPTMTQNGNLTLDCALSVPLATRQEARRIESAILEIPGVVDTGLFLGTAERVLVGYPDGKVRILTAVLAHTAGNPATSGPGR